ncbi:MAG: SGNH/GDSL hydrolase family protein [Bacteroidales bacterium]|nr:SGNH/GDSL hydrolase family protein [Bacteroidales bacterium]
MRREIVLVLVLLVLTGGFTASGQSPRYSYTEASNLTLVGKLFPDTPNPYHRVDTARFKGLTRRENTLVRMSSGLACAFHTNSTSISVCTVYLAPTFPTNGNGISTRGYDLYIRENGKWYYAASGVNADDKLEDELILIKDMQEGRTYDCLLYFPLYSELGSVQIGVLQGADIDKLDNPFRHRIAVFGSSFTHGSSTSRAGMSYPAQFSRNTGLQILSLGVSGNCLLQDSFCDILCAAPDIDAFVFDAFSNPSAKTMEERLFPFIEKLQSAHPGVPLIFQKTIWREQRHFNTLKDAQEEKKMHMVDSLMAIAVKRYKDVYYITPNATSKAHDTSVDGIHPGDKGYTLWAESIRKPIKRILRKYGIK